MMTTKNEDLTTRVEILEGELKRLEGGLEKAEASAQAASERLAVILRDKDELASAVLAGDLDAAERYEKLEEEELEATRTLRVANTTAEQLKSDIAHAKDVFNEEKRRVARQLVGALQEQRGRERERALELAQELRRRFEEDSHLHRQILEQLRLGGTEQGYESYALNERTGSYLGRGVRKVLGGYLS